ncbi:MAG: DNA (cytosine-5-)-methyltransferase [Candidatus Margulisiibacteriota bacterium]
MNVAAVDLFCGIGGLTHGLMKASIPVVAGIDIDGTCKYAYEANNDSDFIHKEITNLTSKEVSALYPEGCIKVLVGCAPCQPFSTHTQKDKSRSSDEKWGLLYSFLKLIREVQPDIVSAENVPAIVRSKVFLDFVAELEVLGYNLFWDKVYCPDYGVPQSRKRLVLLASKFGPISIIPATHTQEEYKTVRDTIGEMGVISAGEVSTEDPLHRTSRLGSINLKRIKQSKPGGTWKDWDEALISPCHKRDSGESYSGVYARMSWDNLAPTMTTQFYNYGTGRFGHPEQDRALSLREGALLQTFPPDYDFINPEMGFSIKRIGTHIGNAVPVRLWYVIGRSIAEHIKDNKRGE